MVLARQKQNMATYIKKKKNTYLPTGTSFWHKENKHTLKKLFACDFFRGKGLYNCLKYLNKLSNNINCKLLMKNIRIILII